MHTDVPCTWSTCFSTWMQNWLGQISICASEGWLHTEIKPGTFHLLRSLWLKIHWRNMRASLQSKSQIAQRQNYSYHDDSLSQSFPVLVCWRRKVGIIKSIFFPKYIMKYGETRNRRREPTLNLILRQDYWMLFVLDALWKSKGKTLYVSPSLHWQLRLAWMWSFSS